MKSILITIASIAALLAPAHAIGQGRIESAKKRAAAENKVVFVVEHDYWDANCPKCVDAVNGNNKTIKRVTPNKIVVVVRVEESDLKSGKVTECVAKAGRLSPVTTLYLARTMVRDTVGLNA